MVAALALLVLSRFWPQGCLNRSGEEIISWVTTISDKKYGKNCYFDNFVFLPPSPSWQCSETMSKICVKLSYGFATLYRGRGGILNTIFKNPIIFCHWLSEIYKKMKDQVLCMAFQITQICFNGSDYVTLHSVMNLMTENGAKMIHKISQ